MSSRRAVMTLRMLKTSNTVLQFILRKWRPPFSAQGQNEKRCEHEGQHRAFLIVFEQQRQKANYSRLTIFVVDSSGCAGVRMPANVAIPTGGL